MPQEIWKKEKFKAEQPTLPGTKHYSHSNLGGDFEARLEATHHFYQVKKLAKIVKNPVEWRYTGKSQYDALRHSKADIAAVTNSGRYIKRVKSDVDFSGSARGRFVCFDAKQFKGKSFPLGNACEHQIRTLLEFEQTGAVAGLMLCFSDLDEVFFCPARVVDEFYVAMLYKGGRKSISFADCVEKCVPVPLENNLIDWLKIINDPKLK